MTDSNEAKTKTRTNRAKRTENREKTAKRAKRKQNREQSGSQKQSSHCTCIPTAHAHSVFERCVCPFNFNLCSSSFNSVLSVLVFLWLYVLWASLSSLWKRTTPFGASGERTTLAVCTLSLISSQLSAHSTSKHVHSLQEQVTAEGKNITARHYDVTQH